MSGGAFAASHYLITSTKQISPKVIKKLHGKAGKTGLAGPTGATGAPGKEGPTGKVGPAGKEGPAGKDLTAETPLPSGQSESGAFSAAAGYDSSGGGWLGAGVTYVQPLANAIESSHIEDIKSGTTTECPGPGQAERGYLCLYDYINYDVESAYGYSTNEELGLPTGAASPGVVLYWPAAAAGEPYAGGVYTVTAP
jgi:hypothetical protein